MTFFFTYIRIFIVGVMAFLPMWTTAQCVWTYVHTTDNFCAPEDSVYISLFPYGGTAPYTYLWDTGETTQTVSVLLVPSDIYFTVTDATGCVYSSYYHVKPGPYIALIGGNYIPCGETSTTLNLWWYRYPPENVTYLWSTGEITPTIDITSAGTYSVTVTDPSNGCTATITTSVESPSPSIEVTSIVPASCGQNNGAVDITVTGEYPPFIYSWSNGTTTQDLNNISSGTYTVTVTSNDGCTATATAVVPGGGNLAITGNAQPNTSCTSPNGSIDITVTPSGSYTYSWSNGSSSEDLTGVTAGTYFVTVSAEGGCSSTASFTVASNLNSPIATATTTPSSCGQNNGSIDLSVSGGASPFEFDWSNGATTEDLNDIAAGTYSVTITDNNGCTGSAVAIVSNNNTPITITGNPSPNTSCITNNGGINITISPGGSYVFDWSNGAITEDIINLQAGSYSVTVTDSEGCSSSASFTVANNLNIPVASSTTVPSSCGQNNGHVDLTVSGGMAPFTFNWSNGETTEDLANIAAGTYTVTITGNNGCIATTTAIVSNSNGTISIIGNASPNTACISSNGSVSITVAPAGSYSFNWSNNAVTEDINNLQEGSYSVTVTDIQGCSSTASFTVIDSLNSPVTSYTTTPASCGQSNGSINLSVSGGASPFEFDWSNGATTEDLTGVAAGNYSVTVTGSNGCTSAVTLTVVNDNNVINITGIASPNTSCNFNNGSIDITITPINSYSINWSDGSATEDLVSLPEGSYGVTVTDAVGCSSNAVFIVGNDQNNPSASATTTSANCGMNDGSIDLVISDGASPYTFDWMNGSTTEDLSDIGEGAYTVTITDNNGCSTSISTNVSNTNIPIDISGVVSPNSSCDSGNGGIDITVTPTGAYTYSWSNGSAMEDLANISAGMYSVTITMGNSCSEVDTFIVANNNTAFDITGIAATNTSCITPNGSIDLTVTPAGNYSYLWAGGETSEDIQSLQGGMYTVSVTNSDSCTITASFNVQAQIPGLIVTGISTDQTSCQLPNGSIDISVTPAGNYSFLWSNGALSEDLQSLSAGSYQVTVSDANSCSSTAEYLILDLTVDPVITSVIKPEICGDSNGSIDLTLTSTGNVFLWTNGASTEDLVNLPAGSYIVTVTASNGCTAIQTFDISNSSNPISLSVDIGHNISCSVPAGFIDLEVLSSGQHDFIWSTGDSTEDLQQLNAGNYIVTVTDQAGCSSTQSFVINDNPVQPIVSHVVNDATCGQSNGAIDITVSTSANNIFLWSNGFSGEDLSNALPGNYSVTVTSDNGCVSVVAMDILNQNSNFTISEIVRDDTSCIDQVGYIDITIIPQGSYSFLWSNGSAMEDLNGLAAGNYEVTITDAFQCSSSQQFSVRESSVVPVLSEMITGETCGLGNGSIHLDVIPATDNSYLWSTGEITSDLEQVLAGHYAVTVTNSNGCSISKDFIVPGSDPPDITLNADLSFMHTSGIVTGHLTVNISIDAIASTIWMPADIMSCPGLVCLQQVFTITETTEIMVMVTDTNGCVVQASLLLEPEPDYKVFIPNVFSPGGDGANNRFSVYSNEEVEEIVILEIFNRWGDLVFVNHLFPPNDPGYGWDGMYKGQMMNPDVFAYRAVVRYSNGVEHAFKGDVTLVR